MFTYTCMYTHMYHLLGVSCARGLSRKNKTGALGGSRLYIIAYVSLV